nr:hypothetical protein [uncultured Devosia sp.]
MTDQNRKPATGGYSTPRWVKGLGIAAAIVLVLVIIAMAGGLGGNHGPGRHMMQDQTAQ